ncbi:MAG: amidohydrolase family protein [Rhodospirillaceae bacterium]|nr:amidohydrolase family protein [Rhodospirillaceae bacterium]
MMRFNAILIAMWVGIQTLSSATVSAQTLTLTAGTNIAAAVSPDGAQIVFDLQGTLWVMPVAGGEAKAITDPLADARQPAWSPDGKAIAFQSFKDGGWHVWTVAPDGTDLKQISSGGFDEREPAWSPDGAWIAFSSDRGGNYDIWVMAADGSEPRVLTTSPANDHSPTWSPDGKRIAFASDRESGKGLYTITFEGVAERLAAPLEGALAGPSWSPDGNRIAFVETDRTGSRLKVMDASSTVIEAVSKEKEDAFPFRAAWLAGDEVIYTADAAIKRLSLATAKAKPRTIAFSAPIAVNPPTYKRKTFDFTSTAPRPVKGIRGPVVSPNAKWAAFAALGDIWTADISKTNGKADRVTNDTALDFDPAWSPDGKLLAYVSDRSGKTELWLRDLRSQQDHQLTTLDAEVQRPVFSPDGAKIAFFKVLGLAGLGGGALHLLDVGTGEVTQLRPNIWAPSRVSWSPDGRKLALSALAAASSRFREGWSEFTIIEVEGGQDRRLTPHPDKSLAMRGDDGPAWSPDGKSLAYVFEGTLWTLPVDGEGNIAGTPTRLTTELADAPSWTGDSKSILYMATDRLARIDLSGRDPKPRDIHPDFTWQAAVPPGRTVIRAGRLFDGVTNSYRDSVDIVIEGNRIVALEPRSERDAATKVIDVSDKTVIPGLIESHSHLAAPFGERLGRLWLAMGVTSVRDPGADPYDALERRESWASGQRPGPRQFYAGGLTDGARVYYGFANSVTTPEHLELEMDRSKRLDADMIKTYVRMPDAMQKMIVAKAHDIGIPVSSHEIYPAAAFGADQVEHLRGTSRRGYSPKQTELGFSYGDVVDILSKTGMTVTPTMGLSGGFTRAVLRDAAVLQHPAYTAIFRDNERAASAAIYERARSTLPSLDRTVAAMQKAIKQIVDNGGRITAGTDSPFVPYGLSFQVELELYEEAGLTPFQVLQSATSWPAERLGVDAHLGTIAPGKLADLAIIDGDPLARIKDIRNIAGVVANGKYFAREELLEVPK